MSSEKRSKAYPQSYVGSPAPMARVVSFKSPSTPGQLARKSTVRAFKTHVLTAKLVDYDGVVSSHGIS